MIEGIGIFNQNPNQKRSVNHTSKHLFTTCVPFLRIIQIILFFLFSFLFFSILENRFDRSVLRFIFVDRVDSWSRLFFFFYQLRECSAVPQGTNNEHRGKKKKERKNEYDVVQVISTNRVDETIAYQRLHLVEWFCGRALVVFPGTGESTRSLVRVLALVDANTRRCPSASIARPSALISRVCAITRHPFPSGR